MFRVIIVALDGRPTLQKTPNETDALASIASQPNETDALASGSVTPIL
jgi:hypothetical protein